MYNLFEKWKYKMILLIIFIIINQIICIKSEDQIEKPLLNDEGNFYF